MVIVQRILPAMSKVKARDGMGRRSRFQRTPIGKRIFLSDRDFEILWWLYRYRYLRATHLAALVEPRSEKRFAERLGDLYHETGLIDRPAAQWRRFDARYQPIVYELSAKGCRYLGCQRDLPHRAVTFGKGERGGTTPHFDHAMMIVDALAETEIETRRCRSRRFVPVDEILTRLPNRPITSAKHPLAIPVTVRPSNDLTAIKALIATDVIPDALYGVEHLVGDEKLYRFFALECENSSPKSRSTGKLSSLAFKQAAYEALLQSQAYRSAWGIPCLELRVLSAGTAHASTLALGQTL
ncbi:replication-relaxation family protein [Microbaculum marinum]|uniref:Replication-relaxation family protein n=1 Tax=Microbaculum marinum TaxID=1764581 RepID=A0AAW9RYV8_9HYPH